MTTKSKSQTRGEAVAEALQSPEATEPLPPLTPAHLVAKKEMASRVLSRRRLLPFVQRMNDQYDPGWVHEDICRRLEKFSDDVANKLSPRLMLLMPPRHGKSELASKNFPAWHLGRHPDHEFIACSYNLSLAMGFSRKVKQIIEDEAYKGVFDTKLDPNNQSTEEWGISGQRGGYVAAGIGGPITGKGAHCVPAGTFVETESGAIDIEYLYQLKSLPRIATPLGPKRALAITKREETELFTLHFASGKHLTVTGAHPIYLPDAGRYATALELYGASENTDRLDLRVVRHAVPTRPLQPQQVAEPELHGVLLRQSVQPGSPRGEARQVVSCVQQASGTGRQLPGGGVLFLGVPPQDLAPPQGEALPGMRRGVSAKDFEAGLLRQELRRYGAQDPHDWSGELALQGRQFLRILVQPDEAAGAGAGQGLRDLLDAGRSDLPPHRRSGDGQQAGELDHAMPQTPRGASQVEYDTLLVVGRSSGRPVCVYDLQVEDAGCFFADEVLTGNCLVIDDPVKNAEEADSADGREKTWEWYLSTAYTRLAPGGGVLVIQTCWHDADLAGRLQTMMRDGADDIDIDQFEVVKYPAIAIDDEFLDVGTGTIVYGDEDHVDHPAEFTRLRAKGDALHPTRYDLPKLARIRALNRKHDGSDGRWWSALYQQNPVPDDGGYFVKSQFKRSSLPQLRRANVFITWDFAISEKKQNDYTVGAVGLQDDDDVLHIAEIVRFKSTDSFFIVESILNLSSRWASNTQVLGLEDGQIYRAIEALLKKRMRERRMYTSIQVLRPITDKLARARALQGRMQQGMVSFNDMAEWYDEVRNEMLRFPAGVHDDQVDALAWMAQMVVGRQAPQKEQGRQMKSWKDKLKGLGGTVGHMAS